MFSAIVPLLSLNDGEGPGVREATGRLLAAHRAMSAPARNKFSLRITC